MTAEDPRLYVPVCDRCFIPLRPDETDPTKGLCPSLWCPHKGLVLSRDQFAWLHQDVFNQSECPPFNGWEPIQVEVV